MNGLHWACKNGNIKMAKLLISFKSNIEAQDLIGRNALYFAVQADQPEIVQLLLYTKCSPWSTADYLNILNLN